MKKEILLTVISFLFILLFIYTATSKLIDYEKFRTQLGQSPLLTLFSEYITWIIPAIEIIISLMLVTQKWRLAGLYASFGLMMMFSAYIIAITRFSEYIPCSCGGILEKMSWDMHLLFNLAFVLLAFIGILVHGVPQTNKAVISNIR